MLPQFDNPVSRKANELIEGIEQRRGRPLRLQIVRQQIDIPQETEFFLLMSHDKNQYGSEYGDFLCQLHSQIQSILNT